MTLPDVFTFTGGVTATAPSVTKLVGTVYTNAAAMTFGNVELQDTTTLDCDQ